MQCAWDGDKADRNARKHGVTFEEAATVFYAPLALIIEDESHPENAPHHRRVARSTHPVRGIRRSGP